MKRIAIITVLVIVALGGAWYLSRPKPVKVAVITVERGAVTATIANTRAGTVDACRRARLSSASGGQIANLPVKKGEHVKQDQLLLELWNEDTKAQLELERRDALAARSRAKEACVTAEVSKRDAQRLSTLQDQKLASEEAADQARGRADASAAACKAVEDAIRVSDARVDVTQAQLKRTQLYAPFDGVIAEINGELGEFVTPSPVGIPTPPTIDLIDATCLYVSAPIDEVDAPRVQTGLPARISLDAFPNRAFPGHVRRVAPYVLDQEKQARTVEIEAEFDNPAEAGLLAGYSADVEVILDQRADALRVPTAVILPDQKVYVLNPATSTLEARTVQIGLANWEFTEITSGLQAGDRVVSSIDREGVAEGALVTPE
jgi:HlyD family secretion protein